jgi:CHAT domain-containing protein/tetratricopeptide (TPR) repeat protein
MHVVTLAALLLLQFKGTAVPAGPTAPASADSGLTTIQTRLGAAKAVFWQEPFDASARRFTELAGLAHKAGDHDSYVTAMALLGYLRGRITGPSAALATLDSAWAAATGTAPGTRALVRCLQTPFQANAALPGALATAQEALALARTSGDSLLLGICYRAAAAVGNQVLDDPARPQALADSAVRLHRMTGDSVQLALSLFTRGYLSYGNLELAPAQEYLSEALQVVRGRHAPGVEGLVLRWLSAVAWEVGDYATSAREFRRADTLFHMAHDSAALSELQQGYGVGALALGQTDSAERLFQAWQDDAARRGNNAGGYFSRIQLAQVQLVRGRWQDALDRLEAAVAFGRTHGFPAWVSGLQYFEGIALLRMGRLTEARARLEGALATSGANQYLDQYAIHSRLAETALRAGQVTAALQEITRASDRLDSLRSTLAERDLRPLAFQTRQLYDEADLGFATIVAGLVQGGQTEAAFRLAERRRARELEDRLLRARLLTADTGASGPARAAPVPDDPSDIVDDHTALLEFLAGPAGQPTTRFVVTPSGLRATVLPSLDSLGPELDRFADQLQSGDPAGAVARRLSNTLLGPAIGELPPSITRLVIVPDGALHRLPFAALPLADGGPLIARFGISLAPSLAVARLLIRRPAAGAGPILALGDPAFGSHPATAPRAELMREAFDAAGGLPRLVASADEARRAAGYAEGSVLRLGEDASEAFLKHTSLTGFRVLHFATHALVDDRTVARTALALAPGGGEDGFVTAGEIAQLSLDADLVVLSACRTADGMLVGGEGVQGLTAPFLQAGARAVLATLWPVSDRGAARFEAQFYRALAGGAPAGEALRRASQSAIAGGEPAAEWAAFVLVGDPTVVVPLRPPTTPWLWGVVLLVAVAAYGAWRVKVRKREAGPSPEGKTGRTRQL